MLIGNNFIGPEGISIDISREKAFIGGCETMILVTARQRDQWVRRKVHACLAARILPYSKKFIPISILIPALSDDRNYIFEPMMDSTITTVLARNDSSKEVKILQKLKFGAVTKLDYGNCFQADLSPDYTC